MRYFTVTYYLKPTGQFDEVINVCQKLRPRDLDRASVILDFQAEVIVKASLQGQAAIRDWQTIVNYNQVIERLQHDRSTTTDPG
jgi:hypothetical protein